MKVCNCFGVILCMLSDEYKMYNTIFEIENSKNTTYTYILHENKAVSSATLPVIFYDRHNISLIMLDENFLEVFCLNQKPYPLNMNLVLHFSCYMKMGAYYFSYFSALHFLPSRGWTSGWQMEQRYTMKLQLRWYFLYENFGDIK